MKGGLRRERAAALEDSVLMLESYNPFCEDTESTLPNTGQSLFNFRLHIYRCGSVKKYPYVHTNRQKSMHAVTFSIRVNCSVLSLCSHNGGPAMSYAPTVVIDFNMHGMACRCPGCMPMLPQEISPELMTVVTCTYLPQEFHLALSFVPPREPHSLQQPAREGHSPSLSTATPTLPHQE